MSTLTTIIQSIITDPRRMSTNTPQRIMTMAYRV
jgi:hypothetical protein